MPKFDQRKIIIDASPLRYLNTGLGQFTFQLLSELALLPLPDVELSALVHQNHQHLVPKNIHVETAHWLRRHAPSTIQRHLYHPYAIWHMTTENTRLLGIPAKATLLLTIHGLHFLDEESPQIVEQQLEKVQQMIARAEMIVVVSQFTANLVKEKLDIRNKPIHNTSFNKPSIGVIKVHRHQSPFL